MTSPKSLARLALVATLTLGLAACALPRSGPYYGEITAEPPAELDYDVVRVTPAVARATRIDERMGFGPAFRNAPPANTAAVAVGDVLSITVWENIDEGLLNPQGHRRDAAAADQGGRAGPDLRALCRARPRRRTDTGRTP